MRRRLVCLLIGHHDTLRRTEPVGPDKRELFFRCLRCDRVDRVYPR